MIMIIIYILQILAIIHLGYTGDEELEKRDKNARNSSSSSSLQITDQNRKLLQAYYATDPFAKGHKERMKDVLHDTKPKSPKRKALSLIGQMCAQWPYITGLNQEETHEILALMNSKLKIDGPDRESKMRDKLLHLRPDLREVDPEIIRGVIHDWYRRFKKATLEKGKIQSRTEEADLLYTYHQVKSGEGYVQERLAEKWKQFRPDLNSFSKYTLHTKAITLAKSNPGFSSEEMEKARERYESVFGAGSGKFIEERPIKRVGTGEGRIRTSEDQADLLYTYYQVQSGKGSIGDRLAEKWNQLHPDSKYSNGATLVKKAALLIGTHPGFSPEKMEEARIRYENIFGPEIRATGNILKWTEGQTVDLVYLSNRYKRKEISNEEFHDYWLAMHPELASVKSKDLSNKLTDVRRRKFKLSPEKEMGAESRLKTALARKEQSQEKMIFERGKSLASQSYHGQAFHQQTSDRMIKSSASRINLELTLGGQYDLETPTDLETFQHSPTPRLHSSYHYGNRTYDPYTVNPFYEHGSSSHPPDNPHP